VVDGDPLKDISVLRNKDLIKMVMKGGVAYIDNLLVGDPQAVGD
jgi:imidazolonepropionase-like amidohydrolase